VHCGGVRLRACLRIRCEPWPSSWCSRRAWESHAIWTTYPRPRAAAEGALASLGGARALGIVVCARAQRRGLHAAGARQRDCARHLVHLPAAGRRRPASLDLRLRRAHRARPRALRGRVHDARPALRPGFRSRCGAGDPVGHDRVSASPRATRSR
jgi:hypothetical protein